MIAERLKNKFTSEAHIQNAAICFAAVCAGLIAVCYVELFKFAEDTFFKLLKNHQDLILVITPLAFLIAWALVFFFAPAASGSGIPQVLAANELEYNDKNKDRVDRLLSLRVMFVKIASSLVCMFGGGAIGREGPTIHICASLFHFFGKWTRRLRVESSSHLWIVTGAGAGLAAAFNTPLGGIVYAIEELGSQHFLRVRKILFVAIIISGLISQGILGNYLYLGSPKIYLAGAQTYPLAILIGFLCGLLGAAWSELLFYLVKMRSRIKSKFILAGIAIVCGFLMALLILHNHYSAGTGIVLVDDILFHQHAVGFETTFFRFIGTIISYLCGAAGGILSPSLAIGASFGDYIAQALGLGSSNIFVLLGMIGFLTGVTGVPFTSFILVMEMTSGQNSIFPMMIAALSASAGANLINPHSFYEMVKQRYLST